MTLPVLEKTWQVAHVNNTLSGVDTTDINDFFLKVKNAAKAFGTHPLTCAGSSDGTSHNMSGTDLLTGQPAMVHADAGSAHSWWVGALNQIASGAQVCFDFDHSETDRVDIIVSALGFTGGSITARPTATDEIVLLSNNSWTGMLGSGDGSGGQLRGHLMLSTDGQCFRIAVANNGIVGGFLLIDKPGDPATGWSNPMISVVRSTGRLDNTSDNVLTVATWYTTAIFSAQGPIGSMPLYPTFESPLNFFTVLTKRNAANEISGEYPLARIGLWHDATVGQRGRHGFVFDLFFTNQVLQNYDTFPSDSSRQFVVLGDAVFPGDGSDWGAGF